MQKNKMTGLVGNCLLQKIKQAGVFLLLSAAVNVYAQPAPSSQPPSFPQPVDSALSSPPLSPPQPVGSNNFAPPPNPTATDDSSLIINNGSFSDDQNTGPMTQLEKEQKQMLDTAPRGKFPITEESRVAFDMMLKQNMPLAPRQVVELRQQIDVAQRAAAIPPTVPPKPVSTTLMVNLAPGTTPPAVRLAQGYVTSLVFVDSTGSPWPISSFDIGSPKAYNIQWDGKSNIILIQAVSPYSNGDIVIRLAGLNTPVTLELVAGQRVVDYRVDLHISGLGPNAKELPTGTTLPPPANQLLLGVLDGVAPPGSRQLSVRGAEAQAWQMGSTIFLRTRFTVLSPGWVGKMVSPDGMNAYELPKTSSILISRYGEPAELKIEGL